MAQMTLPDSPEAFAQATWADILPYYEDLAARPLDTANVERWLRDWARLEEMVAEASAIAYNAYTTDTASEAKEAAQTRFSSEIEPQMHEQHVGLSKRLLDLGYERAELATLLRSFRNQLEIFREENVPLVGDEERLNTQYNKITGGLTVVWEGEEIPLPRLQPYLLDPDRAVRERAWRLGSQPYMDQHDALADIFDQQYALRQQMAKNAGFANYRDYIFRAKDRFDYTPADCERFHTAVEQTVVPAVARRFERRRQQMGLDTLRPWDTAVDPEGRSPLKPFDNVGTLITQAETIFARVDPKLGEYFTTMATEHLLDLDSRKGKAPGGYCIDYPYRGRPFIFMNAVGVNGDVETLLHEAGHAFHVFEAHHIPLYWQRSPGSEMAEVASMSMELLTAPYLAKQDGGYYDTAAARRARIEHLEGILQALPHIAAVDAFQHWIYISGEGHDRDARDTAWLRLRARFEQGVDWSELEQERVARWYRQLHIFLYPFYYIEYGIAQLGALQVWRNSLADHAGALAAYRRALALGATAPLPQLFEAAGAELAFDAETMGGLVALIEAQLAALEREG
ncbi:MAG: M3 family oligoendopeptidase [Chloroflexota bacterium]|nr:M3 family oligoendopeptidase [Chloroflexota bacterium]